MVSGVSGKIPEISIAKIVEALGQVSSVLSVASSRFFGDVMSMVRFDSQGVAHRHSGAGGNPGLHAA